MLKADRQLAWSGKRSQDQPKWVIDRNERDEIDAQNLALRSRRNSAMINNRGFYSLIASTSDGIYRTE